MSASNRDVPTFDFDKSELPAYVRELIEVHLAIEAETAKSAGVALPGDWLRQSHRRGSAR